MIISNIKILYLSKENIFTDVNELFNNKEGLSIGYKDYTISKLSIDEKDNNLYIESTIANKDYKTILSEIDISNSIDISDYVNRYIVKNSILYLYIPQAIGSMQFGLKVENSNIINSIIISGIYHYNKLKVRKLNKGEY